MAPIDRSRRLALAALLAATAAGCATTEPRPLAERVVPCPCTLDDLGRLPATRPHLRIAEDSAHSIARFHPGASRVFRLYDPDADRVAGNQCAYDGAGRLIPNGPAAGTPDYVSPEFSVIGHFFRDVRPFLRYGWREYQARGWAPVSSPCELPSG